ncbi:phosphotransferase [Candidatus Poribacteria bacterium]|nr:phosphotransferase [Candidatus Poribacteria bacterium]
MKHEEDRVKIGLERFLKSHSCPWDNVDLAEISRISDGWENEVYSFIIRKEGWGRLDLILRIYPGNNAVQKASREFIGMKKLYEKDFPVPEVFVLETGDQFFGQPFVIMEKINGRLLGEMAKESDDKKTLELIKLCCGLFVKLHRLDWRPFADKIVSKWHHKPYPVADHLIKIAEEHIERYQRYEFLPVIKWLKDKAGSVKCNRLSVIHLDYHPQNIMIRKDDKNIFVIDWTNINVSDYRYDLAWTLLLIGTYDDQQVREIVFNEYRNISGENIENMDFFDVMACFRRLFSISVSIFSGSENMGMRPEAVELMKRNVGHIEKVYKLLQERTNISIPSIEEMILMII